MNLPPYESIHLARSPLVLVAAQINFEEVTTNVAHFQARAVQRAVALDVWSKLQAAPQIRTTFTPAGAVNEPNRQAYRLLSKDEAWSLVINPDSVILETREYAGWTLMAERLGSAAQAVAAVFDPAQRLRLGLRYVDQIPLPEGWSSWEGLIPEALLGLSRHETFKDHILGSEQRHLLQIDETARCMLRHGLLPDDDQRPVQAYLLDYDVFDDTAESFEPSDVATCAKRLHDYAGSLFRISLTDDLYEWLKG